MGLRRAGDKRHKLRVIGAWRAVCGSRTLLLGRVVAPIPAGRVSCPAREVRIIAATTLSTSGQPRIYSAKVNLNTKVLDLSSLVGRNAGRSRRARDAGQPADHPGLNAIFAACVRSQGFWQFPLSWKRRIGGMARSNAPVGSRAAATLADQRSSPALPAMSVPPTPRRTGRGCGPPAARSAPATGAERQSSVTCFLRNLPTRNRVIVLKSQVAAATSAFHTAKDATQNPPAIATATTASPVKVTIPTMYRPGFPCVSLSSTYHPAPKAASTPSNCAIPLISLSRSLVPVGVPVGIRAANRAIAVMSAKPPALTPEARYGLASSGRVAISAGNSGGPHHQDSGEAKIRESTAGVSRKPSSDGKACGSSSKHLCGLTRMEHLTR